MAVVFATGNPHKARQVSKYLGLPVEHVKLDLPEIQSLDPQEIVHEKAKAAYELLRKPVLVEDVSVTFHALGNLPGPFIKWFLHELKLEGLCRLVDGKDRSATASVHYMYYDGAAMRYFTNAVPGTVVEHPRGEVGWGWNPVFQPEGSEHTYGEMDEDAPMPHSLRVPALAQLRAFLQNA